MSENEILRQEFFKNRMFVHKHV